MNPDEITANAHKIVHEEYPYQGAFTACDQGVGGHEVYDVVYGHANWEYPGETRTIFQREFGSMIYELPPQFLGGALWAYFDHNTWNPWFFWPMK